MDKEYYLIVNGEKIYVSKKVYLAYWQETNREKYLRKLERDNNVKLFSSLVDEVYFQDMIADETSDTEETVKNRQVIEKLNIALSELNIGEQDLINKLFFEELPLRKVASYYGISHPALIKRRDKILKKLKKLMKDS